MMERYRPIDNAQQFGKKIAKVMDDLKSSHVYFIIQMAYGEDMSWEEAQATLDKVMQEK